MPTPAEKRALVFFSAVLSLGAGVRATKALSAEPPPPSAAARAELHRQIVAVDSADSAERIAGRKKHRSKRPVRIGISTTDGSDASVRPDSVTKGKRRKKASKVLADPSGRTRDIGVSPASTIDLDLSLIHISEPTRRTPISYAVFCLKKKKKKIKIKNKKK